MSNASIPVLNGPDDRAEILLHALRAAGQAALARVSSLQIRRKSDGTAVTDADQAAHDVLIDLLSRAFPGETLISEEGEVLAEPSSGAVWHLDPVDGTDAMIEGLASWGPTVCRVIDGQLDVGAFYQPRTAEFWFAARGGGAWLDGVQLRPEEPRNPGRSSLYLPSRAHRLPHLPWAGKTRSVGSSALHLCQVARGAAGATVIPQWALWDVGCGVLLVEEAGRVIADLDGQPLDVVAQRGHPMVAAARSVLPALTQAVRSVLPAAGS